MSAKVMARPGHKFWILDTPPQMFFTDTETDRLRPNLGLGARVAVSVFLKPLVVGMFPRKSYYLKWASGKDQNSNYEGNLIDGPQIMKQM